MTYQEVAVFIVIAFVFQVRNQLIGGPCNRLAQQIPQVTPDNTVSTSNSTIVIEAEPQSLTKGDSSDWGGFFGGGAEYVVHLFEPSIQSYIASRSKWLFIIYYIPSCEFSSPAKTEFASAAKQMNDEAGDKVTFASVNCDINIETCKNQKIEGYPTFLLFFNGKYVNEYNDLRLHDNFVNYTRNPSKPGFFSGWF